MIFDFSQSIQRHCLHSHRQVYFFVVALRFLLSRYVSHSADPPIKLVPRGKPKFTADSESDEEGLAFLKNFCSIDVTLCAAPLPRMPLAGTKAIPQAERDDNSSPVEQPLSPQTLRRMNTPSALAAPRRVTSATSAATTMAALSRTYQKAAPEKVPDASEDVPKSARGASRSASVRDTSAMASPGPQQASVAPVQPEESTAANDISSPAPVEIPDSVEESTPQKLPAPERRSLPNIF